MKTDAREVIERSLLSCAADSPQMVAEIQARCGESPFVGIVERALWVVLVDHSHQFDEFDFALVAESFVKVVPDGLPTLVDIFNASFESAHVSHYCDRLLDHNAQHGVKLLAQELQADSEPDIDDYIQRLDDIKRPTKADVITVAEAIQQHEERKANPAKVHATGIPWIDGTLTGGGLKDGQLMVIGGRPGAGKSVMMAQVAAGMSSVDSPVLFFTLEMLAAELVGRYSARMSHEQLTATGLLFCDSTSGLASITALARLERRRRNVSAIVVDYLQLVEVAAQRGQNREQQVSQVSRTMKRLALDLGMPVIVGSQLGRRAEVKGETPTLSDLRESGAIEQDADIVCLLHYDDDTRETRVDIAKQRNGQKAATQMVLDGAKFRFTHDCAGSVKI
jgi:replicative DNA helicase